MKPRFEFNSVVRVPAEDWIHRSILHNDYPAGTILLLGSWGRSGGFIKLTNRGQFMLLTMQQVYCQEPIKWPHSSVTFEIHDTVTVFDMGVVKKEGAERPGGFSRS